jgi:hypothetical protein
MAGFSRRRLGVIVTASAVLAGSSFAALGADAGRSAFPARTDESSSTTRAAA